MRIAINSRLLVPGKMDGIARFTLESFKLICANHPEHEFTFIYDRKPPAIDFGKNSRSVSIFPPARHPILWYLWFEHSLKRFLKLGKFDLFISPEGWVPGGLESKSLAVIHDLNFFHHPENLIPSHRSYLQYFFPRFARRADRIATVSEFSRQDIHETLNVDKAQIDVVYNGVSSVFKKASQAEIDQIKQQNSQGNEYFIFVGSLHPRKNIEHLIKAFELFKDQTEGDEKLLIVGNRKWWPQELEDQYQSLKHKADILFLGRCEDRELSALLSASIALTYLPYFEGFGIPILEAFQCGTAVITANNTSLPEVGGEAALYCDAKNEKEIAAAMRRMNTEKGLRDDLIEAASLQLAKFSWEKTAKLLWQSVEKCLAS